MLNRLSRTALLLMLCRMVRSIGQGALVADFALYLHALGWSAAAMGVVYTGGLLFGASLTLVAGPVSDRCGRKPFLIAYGVMQVLAAGIALSTAAPLWLGAAAVLGAFGRGANGAAGPFGPVEQAWLASDLAAADFGPVYSFNAAMGYAGMAAGALCGALPAVWQGAAPTALDYRPLFLLPLLGALVTIALLGPAADRRHAPPRAQVEEARAERRREHALLLKLVGVNLLSGLGSGLVGPFMAYWFALRYGEGPGAIGPVLAGGFALASVSALSAGWLTRRFGMAQAVVRMRFVGLALLAGLPFAPDYALAASCYIFSAAFNRGSSGARQAVGLRLVGAHRRGLAASLNTISMQVPRAFGPIAGGLMLDAHLLALPILLAAALQCAYLALYGRAFGSIR